MITAEDRTAARARPRATYCEACMHWPCARCEIERKSTHVIRCHKCGQAYRKVRCVKILTGNQEKK